MRLWTKIISVCPEKIFRTFPLHSVTLCHGQTNVNGNTGRRKRDSEEKKTERNQNLTTSNHTHESHEWWRNIHTHKQRWFQPNKTSSSASNKKKRERQFLIVVGTHQVHTIEETVRIKGLIESKERNTIHTKKTRPTKTCWVIWHFWQHFYYVMMFNSFTTRSFRFVSVFTIFLFSLSLSLDARSCCCCCYYYQIFSSLDCFFHCSTF